MDVSYLAVAPEILLLSGAVIVLMVDVFARPAARVHAWLAALFYLAAAGAVVGQWRRVSTDGGSLSFGETVLLAQHTAALRGILLVAAALGTLAAWPMLAGLGRRAAEGVALVLVAAAGFSLMSVSVNLVLLFVALEIGSIALYVLCGIVRDSPAGDEAAVKYFLLGAFASAIFIYGGALVFAGTGEMGLPGISAFLGTTVVLRPAVILIGLGLLVVGMSFKVTAAPFHSWAPDVYQGAPAGAVGFMAAVAKVGGFAALLNILFLGFSRYQETWADGIAVLAAASVAVGTLLAIVQTDVRRMLAYSGVAHAGFILTGMTAGLVGMTGVIFYLAAYSVMAAGAFAAVSAVSGDPPQGPATDTFAFYRGLGRRSPWVAGMLSLLLIGMSGMPLTSGFIGKFEVFRAAWNGGFRWLVIAGLLASVAAFFYYLRLIVLMYFGSSDDEDGAPADCAPAPVRWALWAAAAVTIGLGVFPGPLLSLLG